MKKILAIATNNAVEIKGKKSGLWLSELTHFLDVIVDAGYGYDIASPQGGKIPLDVKSVTPGQLNDKANRRFLADKSFAAKLENSMRCADVDAAQYEAIYLAGGHGTMFDFRQSPDLQKVIGRMHADGKCLSSVCHGVAGFLDVKDAAGNPIVRGREVTGLSNLEDRIVGAVPYMPYLVEDELKKAGGVYKKSPLLVLGYVAVDGNMITGQNPFSARGVGKKVVERLAG